MDFFISDCHFGHKNIIKYMNRPFDCVESMNLGMIESWNSTVSPEDRVFVVGDVFLCDEDEARGILSQLNGYKVLVAGNHDRSERTMLRIGFDEYYRELSYDLGEMGTALLKHYPLPDMIIEQKGFDYLIHGHLHRPPHTQGLKINVAADILNFIPVTTEYIKKTLVESANSNSENENVKMLIENGDIELNLKIRIEDFSGSVDHIYSVLRKHWVKEEK